MWQPIGPEIEGIYEVFTFDSIPSFPIHCTNQRKKAQAKSPPHYQAIHNWDSWCKACRWIRSGWHYIRPIAAASEPDVQVLLDCKRKRHGSLVRISHTQHSSAGISKQGLMEFAMEMPKPIAHFLIQILITVFESSTWKIFLWLEKALQCFKATFCYR
jgi:hypothetical protein